MKTRIIAGIIMLPLLIVVYIGGYILMGACLLFALLGVREFFSGFQNTGLAPCGLAAYAGAAALYIVNIAGGGILWHIIWFFGVIIASLFCAAIKKRNIYNAVATMAGIFYVIFLSYHIVLTEQIPGYSILVWLVFITAFGADMMAYFVGSAIGRHKLCPKISPKKTVEGAIGGAIGSVAFCGLFGFFVVPGFLTDCLIIGALGGIFAQLGDLTASACKRKMGIKDYGSLIPGHGGVLDRFDSVLFTAPMVCYYIMAVIAV